MYDFPFEVYSVVTETCSCLGTLSGKWFLAYIILPMFASHQEKEEDGEKEVVLRMVHLHITPFDPPDRYCDVTAKTQREGR